MPLDADEIPDDIGRDRKTPARILANQARYREANREKERARAAAYREANMEQIRARHAAHREANRDRIRARNTALRQTMTDEQRARKKERDAAHWEANKERYSRKGSEEKKAYTRAYNEANRDKIRAKNAAYREANKERMKAQRLARRTNPQTWAEAHIRQIRKSAKQRGLAFDLTADDLILPALCPVFGLPLDLSARGQAAPMSPSVDRIDSSLGYVRGNVRVISYRANTLKRDATLDEVRALLRYMEGG